MSISTLAANKVDRNAANAGGVAEVQKRTTLSDALAAVSSYIPTEIIATYTIVLALGVDEPHHGHSMVPLPWFLGMLIFTPVFVWLVYAVQSKEDGRDYLSPKLWPWWESLAACAAFTVWSAALPNTSFARFDWYSPRLAAIALMLISGLLPLVGALVTRTRKPS